MSLHSLGTNPTPPPSRWQPIIETARAIGHAFSTAWGKLTDLIARIKQAVASLWKNVPSHSSTSTSLNNATVVPPPSKSSTTFQQVMGEKLDEDAGSESEDDRLQIEIPPDSIESHIELIKEPSIPIKKEVLEHKQRTQAAAPASVSLPPITNQPIEVPNDGNCLHYAIAVGLAKKYHNRPEIGKLNWNAPLEKLTGDLSKQAELLKEPAATLREQAAKYLKDNQGNDEISFALIEGILSHIDVAGGKIKDYQKNMIPMLEKEISKLKSFRQTDDVRAQIQEYQIGIKNYRDDIKFLQENLPDLDHPNTYIQMSKKDRFYCGIPQVLALTKVYNIPIRVLYPYGEQTFNEQPGKPIVTIKHINGNHFQYLDN